MNKRQREILKIILTNEDVIIDKIAKELGVSEKTVRNNLNSDEIDQFINDNSLVLIKTRGRGISVKGSENNISKALMSLAHSKDSVRSVLLNTKSQYILLTLLFSVEEISVTKIENKLYCSKSVIYETIKNLKVYLKNYNIELLHENNIYKIKGTEKTIRFLMFLTLIDLKDKIGNFNSKDIINIFKIIGFPEETIRKEYNLAVEFTTKIEEIFDVLLVEESYDYLVLKVFINGIRIKSKNYVKLRKEIKEKIIAFGKPNELVEIEKNFFNIYGEQISQNEQLYVIGQLSTLQTYSKNDNFFIFADIKEKINMIIKEFNEFLTKNFGHTINQEERLFLEKFLIHLNNTSLFEDYIHTDNKFQISNNKDDFLLIKNHFLKLIEEKLGLKIKRDKVDVVVQNFLLYIQDDLKVVIVFDGSYEEIRLFTKLLRKKVLNISIKEVYSSRKEIVIDDDIDIIISNYNINIDSIPTIYISNEINQKTINYINKRINSLIDKLP